MCELACMLPKLQLPSLRSIAPSELPTPSRSFYFGEVQGLLGIYMAITLGGRNNEDIYWTDGPSQLAANRAHSILNH